MRTLHLFILIIFSNIFSCAAQEKVLSDNEIRVKKTTKWAMTVPGSGQIINKKYWKAPIVLGGLGASVYYILENSANLDLFLKNWALETDGNPLTESDLRDNNGNLYLEADLEDGAYFYRRNRDLSYLSFFGVYLLSVIDANVDAHMKFFDSSEDLSLKVIPPNQTGGRGNEFWQVGLTLKIGK